MPDGPPHDLTPADAALIRDLVADLTPVRRVAPPLVRTAAWLAGLLVLAIALALCADLPAIALRLDAAPDMWLAVVGSALTAVTAGLAAFELAMPDRPSRWALLPLPALALWIGASGLGCARSWLIPGTSDASLGETMHCLRFIILLSLPLGIVLFAVLRRGYSLHPDLTAAMGGLAVAAAAATLLVFFHPFDASLTDLAVHAGAVTLVILVSRGVGGRLLAPRPRRALRRLRL